MDDPGCWEELSDRQDKENSGATVPKRGAVLRSGTRQADYALCAPFEARSTN